MKGSLPPPGSTRYHLLYALLKKRIYGYTKYAAVVAAFFLISLLSGCGVIPVGFSPETAAMQDAQLTQMPDFKIDPTTIRVLQKQPVGASFMVLVAFKGDRLAEGRQDCLFDFYVMKGRLGWESTGGGGSCSNAPPDPNQPIGLGGSSGSGGGDALGYSASDGKVFRKDIHSVQVTWEDGSVQTALVVNDSYLIVRSGQFKSQKVEALDKDQGVVYSWSPNIDPTKKSIEDAK